MNYSNERLRLKDEGVILLPKLIDHKLCTDCVNDLQKLAVDNTITSKSPESTHIHNAFLFSEKLRTVLNLPEIENIYRSFFGDMYILRNFVASTISFADGSTSTFNQPIGKGWHRDTPQFYTQEKVSVCLPGSITFQLVIALENTNTINSTEFIPKSNNLSTITAHRIPPKTKIPENYIPKKMEMEAGDIAIMDDNTFHRAGKPDGINTRWLLFISFVPWYVRPYFLYDKINPNTKFEKHIFGNGVKPPDPTSRIESSFSSLLSK